MKSKLFLGLVAVALMSCGGNNEAKAGDAQTENPTIMAKTGSTQIETSAAAPADDKQQAKEAVRQLAPGEALPEAGDKPVVVDFFATWCGPCRQYGPIFDNVAEAKAADAVFVRVDVDECPELAEKYGIRSIPTTIVFVKGQKPMVSVGMLSADQLMGMIK